MNSIALGSYIETAESGMTDSRDLSILACAYIFTFNDVIKLLPNIDNGVIWWCQSRVPTPPSSVSSPPTYLQHDVTSFIDS
jgi:hypothetical protein